MNQYLNEFYLKHDKLQPSQRWINLLALKFYIWKNSPKQNRSSLNNALFYISLILRFTCIVVLVYVTIIMIHESDSWIPGINLIFCFGISVDMIRFVRNRKEHLG